MKTNFLKTGIVLLLVSSVTVTQAQKRALSLTDALEMAKQGNKALQIQMLTELNAKEVTREVKGSFLPNIAGNGGYAYYFDRQAIFMPGSFAGTNKAVQDIEVGGRNAFNAYLSLNQPILAPTIRHQTDAAIINEKIENEKTTDFKSRVALQVSNYYFDILMMESQLSLLDQSLQRNVKVLQDSRSLLAQGSGLKSDTLRNFIAVENLKSSLSFLRNNVKVSGIELKRLIGLEDQSDLELTDKLELGADADKSVFHLADEAFQVAEENRKDLKIQKLSIALQQKKVQATQAITVPHLSLIGQYQVQAQADDLRFGQYALPRTSFLGLQLNVPIFNGNRTKSQITQAKIKADQEELRLDDLKDEVKTELATIKSKWKESDMQIAIQQKTVQSAELNHRMMEDRFKNGLGSRLELTDAELALTQAQINYLNALYNLRVLHVKLQNALGLLSL